MEAYNLCVARPFKALGRLEAKSGAFASGTKAVADAKKTDPEPDGVEVVENMGEWFVRVVINGKAQVSTFEGEAYARSFADGQRMRIGLNKLCKHI
ncbi:hypothetical protein D3242_28875 [Mesorhizobium jarvisii]|uniref:Uncharacterized protein n=1 Tax=Mesorhizobium jarvisii TaxID=1777867 RepID=A0AA92XBP6_9HYPH|nr:hypothetical protein D3242_28875 [Mesorhizobium jarvisii]